MTAAVVPLDHQNLYRLPWNYADNGISWLEPTTKCNLRCQGCYRDLEHPVHKTLAQVRAELEVFKRLRKSDCMSIAGGEPLLYPHIVELVRTVKAMGWKPIINSNGLALDEPLLRELKAAGVFGFTFHIDTSQNRPGAKGKSETDLNAVRLHFAQLLAKVGGLSCSFNATVSQTTLPEVPNLVRWAQEHADIVQTMVFILFRSPQLAGDVDRYAFGRKIDLGTVYKETEWSGPGSVHAPDIVAKIQEADPLYTPAAYLNGTNHPESLKWLLANRVVIRRRTLGYVSPRFIELAQNFTHFFKGTYLAYLAPSHTALGKLSVFLGAFIDRGMRRLFGRLLGHLLTHPTDLFRQAHLQSIMIIQPVDFDPDGTQDMCDGCPDMTVHEGKLVWSCRLEELHRYGTFITAAPRVRAS